jgi:hypothetical protein
MVRKTFAVAFTDAAAEVLKENEGAAPPSRAAKRCMICGARGEAVVQLTLDGLEVEAPCEHIANRLDPEGEPAYLVWGGHSGYSALPLYAAWYMGWKFASPEAGMVHILGQRDDIVIGLLLMDEAEALALTRPGHMPCGEQPESPEDLLEFLQRRIRVAQLDCHGAWIAVFQPLGREDA